MSAVSVQKVLAATKLASCVLAINRLTCPFITDRLTWKNTLYWLKIGLAVIGRVTITFRLALRVSFASCS